MLFGIFQGCLRVWEIGIVYKPTTKLQTKVLAFVWCSLSWVSGHKKATRSVIPHSKIAMKSVPLSTSLDYALLMCGSMF